MKNKKTKPHTYRIIVYQLSNPEFRFLGIGQSYYSRRDWILSSEKLFDFETALNRYKRAVRNMAPDVDVEKEEHYLRAKYHELYPEAMF